MAREAGRKAKGAKSEARPDKATRILDAALEVFERHGFESARVDDIAVKAGVGKGTVYLYFPNKTELFRKLIERAVEPVLAKVEQVSSLAQAKDGPTLITLLPLIAENFRSQVLSSERRRVMRVLMAESQRFPEVAQFYHDRFLSRALKLVRAIAETARQRGELKTDRLVRTPQLMFAPFIMAVMWEGAFGAFDTLDEAALIATHVALIETAIKGGVL